MHQTDRIHHVPGRLRIRSRTLCGFARSRNTVLRKLQALEGVRNCRLNQKAGCVTVFYNAQSVSPDHIFQLLKDHHILQSSPEISNSTRFAPKHQVKTAMLTTMVGKMALNVLINKGVNYSLSSLFGSTIRH